MDKAEAIMCTKSNFVKKSALGEGGRLRHTFLLFKGSTNLFNRAREIASNIMGPDRYKIVDLPGGQIYDPLSVDPITRLTLPSVDP